MEYPVVRLKKSKSGLLAGRHPWIFDGALDREGCEAKEAGPAYLLDEKGHVAAVGTYNPASALAFRVFAFERRALDREFFTKRFERAGSLRREMISGDTDSYRFFFAEADGVPGLVVDKLAKHLTVQVGTPGLASLSEQWLPALERVAGAASVWAKPDQGAANRERMQAVAGQLAGETPEIVRIRENGLSYDVDTRHGQKTGFYFDQRENRRLVQALSKDRDVLDGYCYHGAFGANALRGEARSVTAVDSSRPALEAAAANFALNGLEERVETVCEDVNAYLRGTDKTFDLTILDPPALAKRRQHAVAAGRAYKDLFMWGMRRTRPGGLMLACSCSAAVDRSLFDKILFAAAKDARCDVQVIERRGAGFDHPVSIYHPEGEYLKALVLRVV